MKRAVLLATSAMVLGTLMGTGSLAAQSFPHETHSVFFSECSACHAGVTSGAQDQLFPDASTCAACHDGATAPDISWQTPEPRVSSLGFSHTPHAFDCATCHLPQGPENLSALALPQPETCLGCHIPGTKHEQAEQCDFCHAPVVDFRITGLGLNPPFHGEAFTTSHAPAATAGQPECSTCDAENTCTQCHEGQGSPGFHPSGSTA